MDIFRRSHHNSDIEIEAFCVQHLICDFFSISIMENYDFLTEFYMRFFCLIRFLNVHNSFYFSAGKHFKHFQWSSRRAGWQRIQVLSAVIHRMAVVFWIYQKSIWTMVIWISMQKKKYQAKHILGMSVDT